jgi:glycosyl transferase family 25
MKVFVTHYKKLTQRKQFLLEQFKKHNITDYEFVEIDRDELDNQPTHKFVPSYAKSHIALTLSHFYAYKQIAEKYEYALIFEDDVILSANFSSILEKYMAELPTSFDMLFIGDGCRHHSENITPLQHIYYRGDKFASRCSDSYIVSNKCARKICTYIDTLPKQIDLPIDLWLNDAASDNSFAIYWAEPTIVTQGSQNGLFRSSIICSGRFS